MQNKITAKEIIRIVKKKKELTGLADPLVRDVLNKFVHKHNISFSNLSEKEKKLIVKEVRSTLRLLAGRFRKSKKDKMALLRSGDIKSLLNTHSSTAERLGFYPEFRKIIISMNPSSILDLGCGLNPIALSLKEVTYYASDINTEDLSIVSAYFKKNKLNGKTFVFDLQKMEHKLPKTDIALLLKLLDVVDPKHKLTENILKKIPSNRLIVSFSTRKLSGKKMNFPRRYWFEKILSKLSYKYSKKSTDNEVFYFIKKS